MAKKPQTEDSNLEVQTVDIQDIPSIEALVHTLCKGDVIRYINEHPECNLTVNNICDYYKTQGYNVIDL